MWHITIPIIIGLFLMLWYIVLPILDWWTWTFGEDYIDLNHFRRMK